MARRRSRDNREQRPHRCIKPGWPPPAPVAAPPPPPPPLVTTTVVVACRELERGSLRTVALDATRLATFTPSAEHSLRKQSFNSCYSSPGRRTAARMTTTAVVFLVASANWHDGRRGFCYSSCSCCLIHLSLLDGILQHHHFALEHTLFGGFNFPILANLFSHKLRCTANIKKHTLM